jgi:hypothetical protein
MTRILAENNQKMEQITKSGMPFFSCEPSESGLKFDDNPKFAMK